MKTCPVCRKSYPDETMVFCLADGASLLQDTTALDPNATWHLPAAEPTHARPITDPGPTVASPTVNSGAPQPTVAFRPELIPMSGQPLMSQPPASAERSRRSALPWVFAIVFVIGASGVLIAWLLTRDRSETTQSRLQTPTPSSAASPSPATNAGTSEPSGKEGSPSATPNATPRATPSTTPGRQPNANTQVTVTRPPTPPPNAGGTTRLQGGDTQTGPAFGRLMDNVTFTGTNLTYYPRTSPQLCQADCARNAGCLGYTWVKPGGYNPGDSAMCYLIARVASQVSHHCCMSAVKLKGR